MRKRSKLKIYEYQEAFQKYYDDGWKQRRIARYLGRKPSTISRLLRRDVHPCPGIWREMTSFEKAMYAWDKARRRAKQSRRRLRLKSERVRKLVTYVLVKWHWSPEAIADFLTRHGLKISAKAIYNFIKKERAYLTRYLRLRGKIRRQRVANRRGVFKTGVPEKKSIHQRPELLEQGHWEIDTILSKRGGSGGVLTLREMRSKDLSFFLLPDLTSASVMRVLFPFFQKLPARLKKTLTSDNGSEFAELYKLEKVFTDFSVYYCDPYAAWQRGSVENGNGELRWYFPKKTDFSVVSEAELRKAQYKINGKPRKMHGGRSSSAVFKELLQAA